MMDEIAGTEQSQFFTRKGHEDDAPPHLGLKRSSANSITPAVPEALSSAPG